MKATTKYQVSRKRLASHEMMDETNCAQLQTKNRSRISSSLSNQSIQTTSSPPGIERSTCQTVALSHPDAETNQTDLQAIRTRSPELHKERHDLPVAAHHSMVCGYCRPQPRTPCRHHTSPAAAAHLSGCPAPLGTGRGRSKSGELPTPRGLQPASPNNRPRARPPTGTGLGPCGRAKSRVFPGPGGLD